MDRFQEDLAHLGPHERYLRGLFDGHHLPLSQHTTHPDLHDQRDDARIDAASLGVKAVQLASKSAGKAGREPFPISVVSR